MIDIREYPGALNALNQILNNGREATIRVEYDRVSVAEHARYFHGVYASGEEEPRSKSPVKKQTR